jgi:hypothetical protein
LVHVAFEIELDNARSSFETEAEAEAHRDRKRLSAFVQTAHTALTPAHVGTTASDKNAKTV